MATRSGRPFADEPLDGLVRSLYSAGLALVGVGVVAGVLAWASVLEAAGSVSGSAAATTQALGGPIVGVGVESVVLHLAAVAVVAGVWFIGVGLVVDGFIES